MTVPRDPGWKSALSRYDFYATVFVLVFIVSALTSPWYLSVFYAALMVWMVVENSNAKYLFHLGGWWLEHAFFPANGGVKNDAQ